MSLSPVHAGLCSPGRLPWMIFMLLSVPFVIVADANCACILATAIHDYLFVCYISLPFTYNEDVVSAHPFPCTRPSPLPRAMTTSLLITTSFSAHTWGPPTTHSIAWILTAGPTSQNSTSKSQSPLNSTR